MYLLLNAEGLEDKSVQTCPFEDLLKYEFQDLCDWQALDDAALFLVRLHSFPACRAETGTATLPMPIARSIHVARPQTATTGLHAVSQTSNTELKHSTRVPAASAKVGGKSNPNGSPAVIAA